MKLNSPAALRDVFLRLFQSIFEKRVFLEKLDSGSLECSIRGVVLVLSSVCPCHQREKVVSASESNRVEISGFGVRPTCRKECGFADECPGGLSCVLFCEKPHFFREREPVRSVIDDFEYSIYLASLLLV